MAEKCDLIVIGAGIYGIQSARTYLELHPIAQVIILEAGTCVGGVWSRERVYDAFWTQTPLGLLEFSDQPMHSIPKEETFYGFFKATHVPTYLDDYCNGHKYNGSSLTSRIKVRTTVDEVHKLDDYWHVHCTNEGGSHHLRTPRLIDASGLTSIPNFPDLPNLSTFQGDVLHHRDFASFERQVLKPTTDVTGSEKSPKSVAVIGGAKSAADVAYACAKAGLKVSWIIRRSGSGPAAFVAAKGQAGYANSNEFFYTRLTSLLLASTFSAALGYSWLQGLVHRTVVGRKGLQLLWKRIHAEACREADHDRADGIQNGFHNLRPDTELFWQNDSTGVNQREDFFDVIASKVKVYRSDIDCLDETGILLRDEDASHVDAEVIICATGWKQSHPYYHDETAAKLGLPVTANTADSTALATFDALDREEEAKVLKQYPLLDSPWAHEQSAFTQQLRDDKTPFRLWKSMVPPSDPSLVFVGKVMLGNHFRNAEVQALFASAVLDSVAPLPSSDAPVRPRFQLPPKAEMGRDIAHTVAWCRRRYLRKGLSGNWFYWDMIPYTDSLLANLGLSSHRGKGWWQDLMRPGYARDLAGLVEEYRGR